VTIANSVDEKPSIPPRRPIRVKCIPLPSIISTIPSRRAHTPDSTLIMNPPFALCGISGAILEYRWQVQLGNA
jgi:hypothetical protein